MHPAEKTTEDVVQYGRLIFVAMVMIVLIYKSAKALAGEVPATISTVILGLASTYAYSTNKVIRRKVNKWINKK
ncbi:MAG: hypothetical protein QGF25_00685 [Candidatus Woesearchaeota archaeon]|mgnify:CR=1 FL=1|jgi:hypothetical protein|nr:hypothetical protein [Candidatus Woesearchaeota archaeon]MDP7466748.1 hypothetical protein [Candidatus Woesearchaeota archaeon]|tara:strand:- start:537 stop:758 length:222 start_codon:yes stop_codon:yes gene_type:complete